MRFTRKTGMQDDGASSDVDPEEPRSESVPAGKSAKSHVDPDAPRRRIELDPALVERDAPLREVGPGHYAAV